MWNLLPKTFTLEQILRAKRNSKNTEKEFRCHNSRILIYIDDTFFCAETVEELEKNINITLNTLRNCGLMKER